MRLIDADEVLDFPNNPESGTEETIADWIAECNLNTAETEESAKDLCHKVITGIMNVVETATTIEPVRGEWISVEDRLPEDNSVVLAYCVGTARNGNCSLVASCDKGFWFLQNSQARLGFPNLQYVVTHWMPLPEHPNDAAKLDDPKSQALGNLEDDKEGR